MKQLKIKPQTPATTTHTSTSRQELDVYLKELTRLVEKDPKKASRVFADWLQKPSKSKDKKRAA